MRSEQELDQIDNLTISNSIKGILYMNFNNKEGTLTVLENQWRKAVSNFSNAIEIKKFAK